MSSRTMMVIIILVILGGGIWYMQGMGTVPEPVAVPAEQVPTENPVAQEPAPTGKVDDILSSFDEEGMQEAAAVQAGDADAETVLSDGTAITGLSETYDETQL